jgi:hypothetical protein
MACALCETRRPRRYCPGVRGEICTMCCGTEREMTVDCPPDCEFLLEARKHDKPVPLDAAAIPNKDIHVTEELVAENEELVLHLADALVKAAEASPSVVDFDAREALEAAIRTYRTRQSGLYYESLPENPLAAGLARAVLDAAEEFRREETERLGMTRTRDSAVLGVLVFLQHFELDRNNGRRRGRAFLHALRWLYPSGSDGDSAGTSSLVLP